MQDSAETPAAAVARSLVVALHETLDRLLLEATNPWELDEALEAFGFVMPPLEAQDLAGLDTVHAGRDYARAGPDPAHRHLLVSKRMLAEGRLGKKVGVGWYRYPGGGGKVIDPLVEDTLREEAWFAGIPRVALSDDALVAAVIGALQRAGTDLVRQGVAPEVVDATCLRILRYPADRPGPMAQLRSSSSRP